MEAENGPVWRKEKDHGKKRAQLPGRKQVTTVRSNVGKMKKTS